MCDDDDLAIDELGDDKADDNVGRVTDDGLERSAVVDSALVKKAQVTCLPSRQK